MKRSHYYRIQNALKGKKLLILLAFMMLSGVYYWAGRGPVATGALSEEEYRGLEAVARDDSDSELEGFYEARKNGALKEKDWRGIKKVIELKRQRLDVVGGSDEVLALELSDLERIYHDHEAEPLKKQALEYELEARKMLFENSKDLALELLNRAKVLEKRICEEFPCSTHKDLVKVLSLDREMKTLVAKDLFNKCNEVEMRAKDAVASGDSDEARRLYTEAIRIQSDLVADFGSTSYGDYAHLKKMEEGFVTYQSEAMYKVIQELIQEAGNKDPSAAVSYYTEAIKQQEKLNREFVGSRYASQKAVEELELLQEKASYASRMCWISELEVQLDERLRSGNLEDINNLIKQLREGVDSLGDKSRKSDYFNESLVQKVAFLERVKGLLPLLQSEVREILVPLPLQEERMMASRPVNQSMYAKVMGTNPSRNKGAMFPVESLTWEDAVKFCKKLSWVLGCSVRLPERDEFVSAIGDVSVEQLDEIAWHMGNSQGEVKAVGGLRSNELGYFDLLGNVSEWLNVGVEDETAWVAGGSVESSREELMQAPVESQPKNRRSRMLGFRFVVEG